MLEDSVYRTPVRRQRRCLYYFDASPASLGVLIHSANLTSFSIPIFGKIDQPEQRRIFLEFMADADHRIEVGAIRMQVTTKDRPIAPSTGDKLHGPCALEHVDADIGLLVVRRPYGILISVR